MKRVFVTFLTLACLVLSGERVRAGDTLPDVLAALPVVRGEAIDAEALDGRVVLIAFFASWCPPCKYEFPHLNTVQEAYGEQGLRIIAVNVFETLDGLSTPAKLEAFLDDTAPTFPILKGNAGTRRTFGHLDRIPTMFLFDREGAPQFVFRHERNAEKTHLTEKELRAVIEPLL